MLPNVNAPFGLWPIRHALGQNMAYSRAYNIASGYGSAIGRGDPVEMTGTGRNIALAAAANVDNRGVFAGCVIFSSTGDPPRFSHHYPANTVAPLIIAHVWDDPHIVFAIQADVNGIAAADVGLLGDWAAGTVNAATGRSAAYLNVGSASANLAATGGSLRILGLTQHPKNAYGAYALVEVMFAEHVGLGVVAGVGGA